MGMKDRSQTETSKLTAEIAWIQPELLAVPEEKIKAFRETPEMEPYRRALDVALREKPHILSAAEEKLLAAASDSLQAAHTIYSLLCNADLKFPVITNDKGEEQQITHGNFISLLQVSNRDVRKNAFTKVYETYSGLQNALAACLSSQVKVDVFSAQARHFESALVSSLFDDNVFQQVRLSLCNVFFQQILGIRFFD